VVPSKVADSLFEFYQSYKSSISVLEAHDAMLVAKQDVHHSSRKAVSDKFDDIYKKLTTSLKKCVDIAREKGASSWLSALSIHKHAWLCSTQTWLCST